MDLRLASVNVRGLRADSRKWRLSLDLQHLGVDICCVQETHFIPGDHLRTLSKTFKAYSAYYNSRSRGVSWLVKRSLDASCDPCYLDPEGRLCVLDVTIKGRAFRLIGVYAPNSQVELAAFFRRIEQFMGTSRTVILAGDWNAVLDPDLDRFGLPTRGTNRDRDAVLFREFVDKFDLIDKFRNEKPRDLVWTWTGRRGSGPMQLSSYIDRFLVRRVDVGVLDCPSFHNIVYSDHRLVRVRVNLDRPKPKLAGYWKLNTSLFDVKGFRDGLLLTLQRELTGAIIGNKWWVKIKEAIRSFAANFSRRLNLDSRAAKATLESSLDRAVEEGDSASVTIIKAQLASLTDKEHQALAIRARLKRMPQEATNMAAELRAEELRQAADRHIARVTLPDGRTVTTNQGVLEAFRSYYQELFAMEPGLSLEQFDTYLADFSRLSTTEAARCEGGITEDEVIEALKRVGLNKSPGIDGLPYEVYLRLSHIFVPLLTVLFNSWFRNGSIPKYFTMGVIKLVRKSKDGGDGLGNFRPLTMLNAELKILAKILANRLQLVLARLISPEQTCAVKGRTIQDNLAHDTLDDRKSRH